MLLSKRLVLAIASLPLGSFAKHAMTYAPGKDPSKYEKEEALLEKDIERWEKLNSKPTKTKTPEKGNLFGPLRGTGQRTKEVDCVPMAGAAEAGFPEDQICDDEQHRKLQGLDLICVYMPETNGADHGAILYASGPVDNIRVLGASSLISCNAPGNFFGLHYVQCPAIQNAAICVAYNDASSSEVYLYLRNKGSVRPIFSVYSSSRYFDPISHSVGVSAQYYEKSSVNWMARAWPQSNSFRLVAHFGAQSTPLPKIITHHCANPPSVWSKPHGHNRDHDNCPASRPGGRKLGPILCTVFVTMAFEAAAEVAIDVLGEVVFEALDAAGEEIVANAGESIQNIGNRLVLFSEEGEERATIGRVEEEIYQGERMKYVDYRFSPPDDALYEGEFLEHNTFRIEMNEELEDVTVKVPHDVSLRGPAVEQDRVALQAYRTFGSNDPTGYYSYSLTNSARPTSLVYGGIPRQVPAQLLDGELLAHP